MARLTPMRRAVEHYLSGLESFCGYCAACNAIVRMSVPRVQDGAWSDLRESFICPRCELNGRARMAWTALRGALAQKGGRPRALMFERVTSLFRRVAAEFAWVEGSEYVADDVTPGDYRRIGSIDVRHENMLALSCANDSLDVIFHGDVLEHVPDDRAALAECHRALRPGGVMLFTCPFFALEQSIRRARMIDGRIVHALEPAFHGNPLSPGGSLVYTHHGWPLLDDIAAAGFATVETGLMYEPFQGIVSNNNPYPEGHMWPVLFRAIK